MYFKKFPSFLYDFKYEDGSIKTQAVTDITKNIRLKKEILSNVTLYDEYYMSDGETAEIIAEKFYGNPEYHWVVMLANDKIDWLADFPLTETEIAKHISTTYNPTLHSKDWYIDNWVDPGTGNVEPHIMFTVYDNELPLDPAYLTANITYTIKGSTTKIPFTYTFNWPDIRHGDYHNGLDRATQQIWQALPYTDGTISGSPSQKIISGRNTSFLTYLIPGMLLWTKSGVMIGHIASVDSDSKVTLTSNSTVSVSDTEFYYTFDGTPSGELVITTTGREDNPVFFVNNLNKVVDANAVNAIPVTGSDIHRMDNDNKRLIKLISPSLLETLIKNYEELL
jgi:hypothetical protein